MSAAILAAVVRGNLALALAALLILALRRPVRQRFGPLAAYALWVIAPLCLLAALPPPHMPPKAAAPMVAVVTRTTHRVIGPVVRPPASLTTPLLALWALGVATAASLVAARQAGFVRKLGRLTASPEAPDVLRGQHGGAGPMLLGALRPRIVVPADFEERFPHPARALMLAHETVHLRRGDAAVNALAVALQCLAWFNPLVHLAANRLRIDQEIACDAAVLAARPNERRLYAELLLSTALTPFSAPLGCHWPASGAHPLKERLMMLNAVSASPLRRKLGLGLVSLVAMAGAGTVWAANPPAPMITRPAWTSRPGLQDVARHYPPQAREAGLSGSAVIECQVASDGRLDGCGVVREGPDKSGFGEAALQLSRHFQMESVSLDGKPTLGGKVRIPMQFYTDPK